MAKTAATPLNAERRPAASSRSAGETSAPRPRSAVAGAESALRASARTGTCACNSARAVAPPCSPVAPTTAIGCPERDRPESFTGGPLARGPASPAGLENPSGSRRHAQFVRPVRVAWAPSVGEADLPLLVVAAVPGPSTPDRHEALPFEQPVAAPGRHHPVAIIQSGSVPA